MTIGVDDILWVEMPGLSALQVRDALAAARSELEGFGIAVDDGYVAWIKPEVIEFSDEVMTPEDNARLDAWEAALASAREAAGIELRDCAAFQMFPAAVGRARHSDALATLARASLIEIIPAPDPGPIHEFTSLPA